MRQGECAVVVEVLRYLRGGRWLLAWRCLAGDFEVCCWLLVVAGCWFLELELELIQTQMAQKPMLRAEVGMRVRCANKAGAE
jgi:hypothetical protein